MPMTAPAQPLFLTHCPCRTPRDYLETASAGAVGLRELTLERARKPHSIPCSRGQVLFGRREERYRNHVECGPGPDARSNPEQIARPRASVELARLGRRRQATPKHDQVEIHFSPLSVWGTCVRAMGLKVGSACDTN